MRKFEVGKTYQTRSACDYDCIFSYTVISRTERSVTLETNRGTVRRGVKPNYDKTAEMCLPEGRYSMCPVITADKIGA